MNRSLLYSVIIALLIVAVYISYDIYRENQYVLNNDLEMNWKGDSLSYFQEQAKIGRMCYPDNCITYNGETNLYYLQTQNFTATSPDMISWTKVRR